MGLAQQLRELDNEQLAQLLLSRPDLLERPADSFEGLAGRAAMWGSQARCMASLDLFSHQLVELVALAGKSGTVDDVVAMAGPTVARDKVEAGLRRLHGLGLAAYDPPSVRLLGDLVNHAGRAAGIGRPARQLLALRNLDELRLIARTHGIGRDGPGGFAKKKPQLIAAIASRLEDLPALSALLAEAPPDVLALLKRLDDAGRYTIATYDFYRQISHPDPSAGRDPVSWLRARGLLIETTWGTAELVGEVTLALRGGILFPGITAEVPPLVTRPLDPGIDLAAEAGQAASRLLDLLVRMLHDLAADPAPGLKSGGVGVRVVRRVAALTELSERDAALLIEVAGAAGLVDRFADPLRPSALVEAWLELEPADRWLHVLRTWMMARSYLRAAGARDDADKPVPPLSSLTAGFDAPLQRRAVLLALEQSPANHAVEPVSLGDRLLWSQPHRWISAPSDPDLAVEWFLDEARFVGAVVLDALAPAARLELLGDFDGARAAIELGLPEVHQQVILQADLTALAMGTLDPRLAGQLAQLAEVESRGSATVYRFTPASLGRAVAAGADPAEILAFLQAHSRSDVPQPLSVLITDVGRRYGRARVGSASSYLRCEDPALLAELVRHRRLAKLALRTLAPTVAVSAAEPESLLVALRAAGYLPAEEDETGALVVSRPRAPLHPIPTGPLLSGPSWKKPEEGTTPSAGWPAELPTPGRDKVDALVAALRAAPPGRSRPSTGPGTGARRPTTVFNQPGFSGTSPLSYIENFDEVDDPTGTGVFEPFDRGPGRFGLDRPDAITLGGAFADDLFSDDVLATEDPRQYAPLLQRALQEERAVALLIEEADEVTEEIVGTPVEISSRTVLLLCADCTELHDVRFADISGVELLGPWADERRNQR